MQSVSELTDLQGKKVILRLDLNVPLNSGEITDTTRIDKVLPTVKFLLKQNSKIVILSHVGRPKGKVIKDLSLKPIQKDIEKKLNEKIKLIEKNIYEIKKDMLDNMKQGSVIVDLAVESGGNCEYSQLGKVVSKNGLKIVGHANVPGRVANNASSLFSKNISNFLKLMNFEDKKKSVINKNDEIIKATLVCSAGKILIK